MNTKCIIAYELYDLSPKIDKKSASRRLAPLFSYASRLADGAAGDGDLAVFGGQTRFPSARGEGGVLFGG